MNTDFPTVSVPTVSVPSLTCPSCGQSTRQNKAGFNKDLAGRPRSQRYECQHCHRTHTPAPKHHGYDLALRRMALQQYVDGTNLRRIARQLDVATQTVANWVDAAHARLPAPTTSWEARRLPPVDTLEMDELFTCISEKKNLPSL
jgi:transposase-like protein